jgi:hypothetical protein
VQEGFGHDPWIRDQDAGMREPWSRKEGLGSGMKGQGVGRIWPWFMNEVTRMQEWGNYNTGRRDLVQEGFWLRCTEMRAPGKMEDKMQKWEEWI